MAHKSNRNRRRMMMSYDYSPFVGGPIGPAKAIVGKGWL